MPPPIRSAASCTTTSRPARANVIAAASPLGPEPTTTALRANGLPHALDAEPERKRLRLRAVERGGRRDDQVRRDRRPRRRLARQHVERRAAETVRTKRVQEGRDVDHRAARRVDEKCAGPHRFDLGPADEPTSLRGQRYVHRNRVARAEQLIDRREPDARPCNRREVSRPALATEREQPTRNGVSDPPEA